MIIPGYVVGSRIGSGSHGVVYEATSLGVGRPVAIKVIGESGDLARRFLREVDALARLSWHPHIVQVLDSGVLEDGTLWLAMELLGAPLSRLGALGAERVADIGVQVADALAVAHHEGIIHRDVKPGNVLSAAGGLVKLGDFGIAADLAGDASTLSKLLGTVLYLAPEVLDGAAADEASDQYSLAATLCALAVGGSPFATAPGGQGIGALIRAKSRLSNERLVAADLPEPLTQAIGRGMQPNRSDRFESVEELAKALLAVQTGQGWATTRYIGPGNHIERGVPPAAVSSAEMPHPRTGDQTTPVAESARPRPGPPARSAPTVLRQPPPLEPSAVAPELDSRPTHRPNRWLIVAAVAIVFAVAAGVVAFVVLSDSDDGSAAVDLLRPRGVAVDPEGAVYIADEGNHRVVVVGPTGVARVAAGTSGEGAQGDGGPATEAALDSPSGVAVGDSGKLYITDYQAHLVRAVDADGVIHTVAGTGGSGLSGDEGPALDAEVHAPAGIAVGPDGTVFLTDLQNHRVRAIDSDGIIRTFAGKDSAGFSGDGGPATEAELDTPAGLAVDGDGVLYIADTGNHRIRAVETDGTIRTVAGTGTEGFSGDGGQAIEAELARPAAVAVGPEGSLYIADESNHRVRVVGRDGIIRTAAGSATRGLSGDDGPAVDAQLNAPVGVSVGSDKTLYITDFQNNRIRAVTPDGIITTFAG